MNLTHRRILFVFSAALLIAAGVAVSRPFFELAGWIYICATHEYDDLDAKIRSGGGYNQLTDEALRVAEANRAMEDEFWWREECSRGALPLICSLEPWMVFATGDIVTIQMSGGFFHHFIKINTGFWKWVPRGRWYYQSLAPHVHEFRE